MIQPRFARTFVVFGIAGGLCAAGCSGREPTVGGGDASGSGSGNAPGPGPGPGPGPVSISPAPSLPGPGPGGVTGDGSISLGPGPDCASLAVPRVACAGGAYASSVVVLDEGECELKYRCPVAPVVPPASSLPASPSCAAPLPEMCGSCLALPHDCQVCPDGATECAHYVLQDGVCAIEVCPPGATAGDPMPIAAVVDAAVGCSPIGRCMPNALCNDVTDGCEVKCECTFGGTWQCVSSCQDAQ
jgi:hypothetical protein